MRRAAAPSLFAIALACASCFSAPADATDRADLADLAARRLLVPVASAAPSALVDTYQQDRAGRAHEALDIPAPRGTPVVAVEDGRVAKLFLSRAGGLTVYQFDPGSRYAYYYAHLDRYADGLRDGDTVRRGQVIGFVGSTGNASADSPHLHFAIFRLGEDKHWWQGRPLNPYRVWHPAP